jgi:broad specificity phosphatase PhoE
MTQLLLVRHGQTRANAQRVWQGWTESSLSALGVQQAEATARHLAATGESFDQLYSSPLERARHTAQILGGALALLPVTHKGLKEMGFGKIEGLTFEEFEASYPNVHRRWLQRGDLSFTWPDGESRAGFHRRVWRAAEEILTRHEGQRILMVAHGGTLRVILARLFPKELGQWWTYGLGNCSLTQIEWTSDGPRLVRLNDLAHLSELASEDTWVTAFK